MNSAEMEIMEIPETEDRLFCHKEPPEESHLSQPMVEQKPN